MRRLYCALYCLFLNTYAPAAQEPTPVDTSFSKKMNLLQPIVVTGTKTAKRKNQSAVWVSVLSKKALDNLQANTVMEALKFQPGLRVETNCQTCNYSQLRMNGLPGSYSQILINSKPLFSPLLSLYGLEQLPINNIEKIEVLKGAGASLYGSSTIGGTVNIFTRAPVKSQAEVELSHQRIGHQTSEWNLQANHSWVNHPKNLGASFYLTKKSRAFYDANQDGFSELPKLDNQAAGFEAFYKIDSTQTLQFALSYLEEYRLGGDMQAAPTQHLLQAEERKHEILMASLNYEKSWNANSSLSGFLSFQQTNRKHYTGIFPDSTHLIHQHLSNPPFGHSKSTTLHIGAQWNQVFPHFFLGKNQWILGAEILKEDLLDQIPAYRYQIDQHSLTIGNFIQSDWQISPSLSFLSGIRMDKHNLIHRPIFSPRAALLIKLGSQQQIRMGYATGFKAPQAWDADLHMAFAGGGVSRVGISKDLKEERAQSLHLSYNTDYAAEKWILGFTLEGFLTKLKDAFSLSNIGSDSLGLVFEKINGDDALVAGINMELRAHIQPQIEFESGFTFQSAAYQSPVSYSPSLASTRSFLRTPNRYGYANLTMGLGAHWKINVNAVYTGKMQLIHYGGSTHHSQDSYFESPPFLECSPKIAYQTNWGKNKERIEFFLGFKNLFNAYQQNFDLGKNRDSNFIYGPAQPKTFFLGCKFIWP